MENIKPLLTLIIVEKEINIYDIIWNVMEEGKIWKK